MREIVFGQDGAAVCVIGSEIDNRSAIHAHEKAGFHRWKTVEIPDEPAPELLLRMEREVCNAVVDKRLRSCHNGSYIKR